jgi:hypothetical protein
MTFSVKNWFFGIAFSPTKTLSQLQDQPFKAAILYYLLIMGIFTSFMLLLDLVLWPGAGMNFTKFTVRWYYLPFIVIFGWLFYGLSVHIGVLIVGGKGGFLQTMKAVMFCATPFAFIGWIPLIGFLSFFWGAGLVGKALKDYHRISPARANFAGFSMQLIILMVLFLLFMWYIF